MSHLFQGLMPWDMERITLTEYVGLHKYREALEHQDD